MPKINAVVTEDTRKALRFLAAEESATVQAVTAAAINAGLKAIQNLPSGKLARMLQPDGRRKHSSTNGHAK